MGTSSLNLAAEISGSKSQRQGKAFIGRERVPVCVCVCASFVCIYFAAPFIFQSGLDSLCFLPLRTHVVRVRCVYLPYLVPLKIPGSLFALFAVYLGSGFRLSLNITHFQTAVCFSVAAMKKKQKKPGCH